MAWRPSSDTVSALAVAAGGSHEVVSIGEALDRARKARLDLVEVSLAKTTWTLNWRHSFEQLSSFASLRALVILTLSDT